MRRRCSSASRHTLARGATLKLKPRTFHIQWDVHAWSGVVASLFLFVIFYCGVFALFEGELEAWQAPASSAVSATLPEPSYEHALELLRARTSIPRGACVDLRVNRDSREAHLSVSHAPSRLEREWVVDRQTEDPVVEHSRLAAELYLMHFFYRVPYGEEFSGFLALGLFVALVSGLVIHLKDLRRQWWQFRPQRRVRISASDAHKVLGVFGLPFAAVFAWSGALLGMFSLVVSALAFGAYGGDDERLSQARGWGRLARVESGVEAASLPLDELVARAGKEVEVRFGGEPHAVPNSVAIELYGDQNAWLNLRFGRATFGPDRDIQLSATSGAVLTPQGKARPPAKVFERILFDLHFANFGGLLVKVLYALLTLAVCAVIVTGNVVWLERRDAQRSHPGNRLLERLSVGFTGGVVLASACYFAANRALPVGLPRRADVEFGIFLAVWAVTTLLVFTPCTSARGWAKWIGGLTSITFGGVLVADLMLRRAELIRAAEGPYAGAWVGDILMLALALSAAAFARGLRVSD